MPEFHLVRVFVGPGGSGGNPLAVFMDGRAIPPERRLAVTADLGYSETVYVDDPATGRIEIYVPTSELPFAGHRTVGTAWLLTELGVPTTRLEVPAGEVPTWREDDLTWIGARPEWVDFRVKPNFAELPTSAEVDALPDHADEPWLHAWAWQDESAGRIRARSFPTWAGITEDEASGAAAVLVGAACGSHSPSPRASAPRSPSGRVQMPRSRLAVGVCSWRFASTEGRRSDSGADYTLPVATHVPRVSSPPWPTRLQVGRGPRIVDYPRSDLALGATR